MALVEVSNTGGVCCIQLNRPEKKNAISLNMYQLMADALVASAENVRVKVVVITGNRETFTAGNDLADFLSNPDMSEESSVYQFLQALMHCPLPVIAAVEGYAVGIGSTLLLHCEQVFASNTATFSLPFINLGLVPEAGSSMLLPRLVGYQKAADLLLNGDNFSAEEAREFGFVSRLTAPGDALSAAFGYAQKLTEKSRETLIETKRLLRRDEEPLKQRVEVELGSFVTSLSSPAAVEAMSAFMAKRKPDFSNL